MELFKLKVSKESIDFPFGPFKLIKLTDDKYSQAYVNLDWYDYRDKFETIFNHNKYFQEIFRKALGKSLVNADEFLEKIPIYLVDTQMSDTDQQYSENSEEKSIHVPSDKRTVALEEFDIDKWLKSKDGEHPSTEEKSSQNSRETELLAIYINDGSPRIFIWVDKIIHRWPNNSEALFTFILFHELAHAMMDVTLYGVQPAKNFTERDVPYVFIEESFADALALKMVDEEYELEKDNIMKFIKSQGGKYSKAVIKLWKSDCLDLVSQWMAMKVLFDYDLAHLIHDFWKDKDFNKLICFESVGHPQWFARKKSMNKWILTDATSLMPVQGVNEYERISLWTCK